MGQWKTLQSKRDVKARTWFWWVFVPKKVVLDIFVFSPEMHSKAIKIILRFCKSSCLLLRKKMMSSMNYKCDTFSLPFPTTKKLSRISYFIAFNINLLKNISHNGKKKGESRSTYLKPRHALTHLLMHLFISKTKLTDDKHKNPRPPSWLKDLPF